ncbi:MAG: NAD(P)H-dependent oxidoreductase [Xanthobacteraceae bacterium]
MTTNILVAFYSTYGHVHRMALAVAEGAQSVPDTTVRLRRIAELEEARKALSAQDAYVRAQQEQAAIPVVAHDDLRWAHGIAWGTPTRFGNMSAQMKQFVDTRVAFGSRVNWRTRPRGSSQAPAPSTAARRRQS